MTDSVAVFPPGYRLTDSTDGSPLVGAVIEFYDAGTTTPKTVYSDDDLLTSIGTTVTTDSLGYPTSDAGTTKSLVYVGTSAYKVVIKTSGGTTISSHDDVKGAVATVDSSDLSVQVTRPVVTKSLDYTVLTADQNKILSGNCTAGDVTFTLPSAVTAADGFQVTFQHAGTANQVLLASVSSQTITSGATSFSTVMPLSFSGEEVTLVSDGANWRVTSHTGPLIKRAQGIITVADRLTAPPGSEVNGAIYLISGAPSGGWSSFASQDLAQYTSSAWVKFTPPSDCGWRVYVQDEDAYYCFVGSAWVAEAATQANQETATDVARYVTPGRQQYHPSALKAWWDVDQSSATAAIQASHSVSSVTDSTTGQFDINLTTAMSAVNYAITTGCTDASAGQAVTTTVEPSPTVSLVPIRTFNSSAAERDLAGQYGMVAGDQ